MLPLPLPSLPLHAVPCDRAASSKIVTTLSKAVAKAVGKPEQYVMVSLRADTPMCFGGTEEPCAYGELVSIGAIGGDKNKKVRECGGEGRSTWPGAALSAVAQPHRRLCCLADQRRGCGGCAGALRRAASAILPKVLRRRRLRLWLERQHVLID